MEEHEAVYWNPDFDIFVQNVRNDSISKYKFIQGLLADRQLSRIGLLNKKFNSRLTMQRKITCHCCNGKSEAWYCKECVSNGDFYHSKVKIPERFAEKKIRLRRYVQTFVDFEKKIENGHFRPTRKSELLEQIEQTRGRINLISKAIETKKENLSKAQEETLLINKQNMYMKGYLPVFKTRLLTMQDHVNIYQSRIEDKNASLRKRYDESKEQARLLKRDLLQLVFPIQKIRDQNNSSDSEIDSEEDSLRMLLADAVQTHYVQGQWVHSTHFSRQENYYLVSSVLPGSGHYADFLSYQFSGTEEDDKKNAQNICAGLTLLSQLVDVLFRILLIPLPKRIVFSDFSEFGHQDLSKRRFQSLVTRLNIAVIYMCASQGVRASALHPTKTVANLMTLIEGKDIDFGRRGYFKFDRNLLEDLANSDWLYDGSDSDSENEWENVCNLPLSEIPQLSISPSFQATGGGYHRRIGNDESAQSGIVSAAASMISIFRGLTGTPQK